MKTTLKIFISVGLVCLCAIIMPNPAQASVTTGSIVINYDTDGNANPDCVGLPTDGSCIPWNSVSSSGNLQFCLNSAVKYASGLSDVSGLNITYTTISKRPPSCLTREFPGGSYSTLNVSFSPKCGGYDDDYTGCSGNAVYWFDSCDNRLELYQQCTANQTCSNAQCINLNITCSTNAQCGTSGIVGNAFCQGGNVYKNYKTYTCNNPGTALSSCSNSTTAQLQTTCGGNQTCSNGSCVSSCTDDDYTGCYGNAVYWFDSCDNRLELYQQCTANQTCQNAQCVNLSIACSTNAQCGTSGIVGNAFCQGNSVYKNYKTYTCNNPGTASSYCSDATTTQLQTTCSGNQTCANGSCVSAGCCSTNAQCGTNSLVGDAFCQGGNVYKNFRTYTCNNAGTSSSTCSNTLTPQLQTTCSGSQTCSNGSCASIACTSNSQCGTSGPSGSLFCQGNNVYQNYTTYTCNNPGTSNSSCTSATTPQINSNCNANQTCSNGSCTNTNNCTSNYQQKCSGNNLYWYDSCGNQQSFVQYCANGCSGNACINSNCTSNYQQRCSGNNLYWYDSCGNQQSISQYCTNGCSGNSCQTYNNNCTSNSYQSCSGNNLYWYDSCGNQQSISQYCTNGCSGNSCQNYNYNNNNYGFCTYHAYKLCVGNNSYWYNSCGIQQDLYTSCGGGQTCQYGQCATYIINPVLPPIQPINSYVAYYRTSCSGSSVRWYDSLGADSGLYRNCNDGNSCTADSCLSSSCVNTLKCDGTTCATGSADFNTYCATNVKPACGNGLCEPALGETNTTCLADCKLNNASNLVLSFFAKQDANATQWQKAIQIGPNSQVYFMATATNNTTSPVDNVIVSANIPGEIFSLGNLKVDGIQISGDIVSGINIGSLPAGTTKPITFEGKTQGSMASAAKQGTISTNASGVIQSDSVSINLNSNQAIASVAGASTDSGFWNFLKKWYMWIISGLVLILLFIVVFKRLSSEV